MLHLTAKLNPPFRSHVIVGYSLMGFEHLYITVYTQRILEAFNLKRSEFKLIAI